ncbi:hypothetical protein ISU10_13170 [Nocardioides agariphilus]|uniref:Uncharacterized protein n=1 Tax=Nocardioides agariphilus TaxID=433664 RepID=A0A930YHJ3_9ACTN|nr:DUF4064 domain-containing protein [Nocardioides agariphilus]MBF4768716.1 hypothetical protein [Nocardioides agariphilus]
MSDSSQGGPPPSNPYGGSSGETPYGQQPASPPPADNPYGQPSADSPYGTPPAPPNPYAQQPQQPDPYGQPPATNPYQAAPQQPQQPQQPYGQYTSPYGQQLPPAGPLGDGLDMYGRPLTRGVSDGRPGTVTAAGWITIVLSGLTGALFAFLTLALIVAKDDVLTEVDKAIAEQGATGDFDAEAAFGVFVAIMLVFTIWCVIATVLGVMVLRRGKVARILLIISAVVAGLLCLLMTIGGAFFMVLWLLACVLVVILLCLGDASQWFRDRY